jgi:hypothetical protein
MTLKEELLRYCNKEKDAISLIRGLSGMFNPDHAVDLLMIICCITRIEQGDLDVETFKKLFDL